jgi:hypothetical protein
MATPGLQGSQYPTDVTNHADTFLAWLNEKQALPPVHGGGPR